ncbi:hypothetical protein ACFQZ4_15690 [Catellatospora coxensis]|uniref:Uncharacterized protein n=1 Tax=Catellatospora coxensis TaxID=310354 RepID=A0A8J3KNX5_9ACTN|nr:hypothetical protein [Catellatospora coxensis]GIG03337.1 hypothetical protein Cco03nite_00370 [Catellatospora coxensis]
MREETGDQLTADELVPTPGGRWSGLLFDNPKLGISPYLSWSFYFPYADVEREYGASTVSLSLDWITLAPATWRDMAGQGVNSAQVAGLAEASVYFFQHHSYDNAELQVVEQRGTQVHVTTTVSGDLDGLGVDPIGAERWLSFSGIRVSVSSVRSVAEASTRLGEFIDVAGLSCVPGVVAGSFVFRPVN